MRASLLACLRTEPIRLHEITSMTHHKPSNSVLVTSIDPDGASGSIDAQVCFFHPRPSTDLFSGPAAAGYVRQEFGGRKPAWLLGSCLGQIYFSLPVRGLAVNAARICPASGPMSAILATSHGIVRLSNMDGSSEAEWVFYAGCRDARMHRIDMRMPYWEADWDWYRHHSAVAHVRTLDDNHILAAGPKSSMAIYDVRWGKKGKEAMPVVRFPEYRNAAHLQIGLDVTHDVGGVGGLGCGGVVAAAMDDGTVGIFSLRSGRKLKAGDVDDPEKLKAVNGVVKALQFEKMPWEKETSLFVGVGPVVKKFSFGVDDDDDEW
ncbi:hypothetical protein VP1G_07849 [Cytospora mali]|uniref:Uncharacterized protein n=1 Tax=Cytospora mali TaxID=578113 RepID=A0A194V9G4_CYTMA|nr:hypothetical protein VP1G_07849 [Valsa mali var. pyri (nom. inval.)]